MHTLYNKQNLIAGIRVEAHFEYQGFSRGVLSSSHPCEFKVNNINYYSINQYMAAAMARISNDKITLDKIIRTRDIGRLDLLVQLIQNFDSQQWEKVADDVFYESSIAKYHQNPHLAKTLLDTKEDVLVYSNSRDTLEGAGIGMLDSRMLNPSSWPGLNTQGFALMQVRDRIRELAPYA